MRQILGKAVDDSIVEILPPVVDRSVTIALITTRELVLKDFAFDKDHSKVLNAADLIVQNLAGSLALVTCREPLRMSLTTNIKKAFEVFVKLEFQEINEEDINDITVLASRENLEFGCTLIKKEVIDKALKKVREDPQIL
jgi:CCR4-NOT transcription complex subunit 1